MQESLGLKDPKVLQDEIEQAKPKGAVDEVFKKYVISFMNYLFYIYFSG